jgi:hypothetical protein
VLTYRQRLNWGGANGVTALGESDKGAHRPQSGNVLKAKWKFWEDLKTPTFVPIFQSLYTSTSYIT